MSSQIHPGRHVETLAVFRDVDVRGSLAAIEHLPFEIKRVFILTALNTETSRANHAVSCDEFITILSGACKLEVRNKEGSKFYALDDPTRGYLIPAGTWIRISQFSEDASLLVACSETFEQTEYFLEPQI